MAAEEGEREGAGDGTTSNALRIAYVNVHGLDSRTFDRLLSLLGPGKLDIIIAAETWYVGYDRYTAASQTLAYTPRPGSKAGSRHTGGLCLLASSAARMRVGGRPEVGSSHVMINLGGSTIAGIYLPPAMPEGVVLETLEEVRRADVVLGDINVRYSERTGMGTPKDRAAGIATWAQASTMFRLQPREDMCPLRDVTLADGLTVDHCFVQRTHITDPLYLLSNESLGIMTDHRYTLCMAMTEHAQPTHTRPVLLRFRIRMLASPMVAARLVDYWKSNSTGVEAVCTSNREVGPLNNSIVAACQSACRHVLGEVPAAQPKPASTSTKRIHSSYLHLVRQVFALDRQNGPLYSADPEQDALDNAADVLRQRYSASNPRHSWPLDAPQGDAGTLEPLSLDDVKQAIADQDATKACGADGVHIRVLKVLCDTTLPEMLATLYNACLAGHTTPDDWNMTNIHLIIKDTSKPKTIHNARPITLICIFRKLFEAILLKRVTPLPSMKLHPAQAGFRSDYSTLTLAGVVHIALDQKLCAGILFLDFRSAFDTVDHALLRSVLLRRGCPVGLVRIFDALNADLRSRVIANAGASDWFPRTRGVLQGSPLSPLLWNIIADDLLEDLNRGVSGLPRGVFYADDGALLYTDHDELLALLARVETWSRYTGIEVNVPKCGHISLSAEPPRVFWGNEEIPLVERYQYLGFPVSTAGIDFETYLECRMNQALGRASFMARHSASWGTAVRLQAYRQYLAPIIEYGAPLMWAWAAGTRCRWIRANARWKELVQWVAGGKHGWRVSQNLLGLPTLEDRFECLHMSFLFALHHADRTNPLHGLLFRPRSGGDFRKNLRESNLLSSWKAGAKASDLDGAGLQRFQRSTIATRLARQARRRHMTSIMPWASRMKTGTTHADTTLEAPRHMQDVFFQYRRGVWCFRFVHDCPYTMRSFRRGDEECECQGRISPLSRSDRRRKAVDAVRVGGRGKFTDVDFLLNDRQWERAYAKLARARLNLAAFLDDSGDDDSDSSDS